MEDKLLKTINRKEVFNGHIGIALLEAREGYAKGEMVIEHTHYNRIGSVHGGATFTLADTVAGTCASSFGSLMTTVSANMNYLSPAMGVKKLVGKAKAIKRGKNIVVVSIEIEDENNRLIAQGTFTFYNLNKPLDEITIPQS